MTKFKSEIRDGMRIDWDVPITMDDGVVLRADIFRPIENGRYPVLLSYNPYGKGMAIYDSVYSPNWKSIESCYPEVLKDNSNKYQSWELPNPERWVNYGYVCARVDSRGTGRSPGFLDIFSPRETKDCYDCIEWAGVQDWSNGKVGLTGISYLATNQWQVAPMQPPHLAAICPFEGCSDFYREMLYHAGIKSIFVQRWYPRQVTYNQHGLGEKGLKNPVTGEWVSGPETLGVEELAANRVDVETLHEQEKMWCQYYADRKGDWSKIKCAVLSCGNWGGNNLHLRGNIEAYLGSGSEQKWLEIHGREHFCEYYTDYGEKLQRDFFDHFLAGKDTWKNRPPVMLRIRQIDDTFIDRGEQEWPLARTQWTKLYFDSKNMAFAKNPVRCARTPYEGMGKGLSFFTEPLKQEVEITGPLASKLFISSSTSDADIFITLRILDPQGKDVTFIGASDPKTMPGNGWLRASHRKLDKEKTTFYRPWHTHDELQPLNPGEIYELDVEVWPTCLVIPAGYRFGVTITGCDFELDGPGPWPTVYGQIYRGNGCYQHKDDRDRPSAVFNNIVSLFCDEEHPSCILLPLIPPRNKLI